MVPIGDLADVTLAIEDTDEMKKTVKMKKLKERKKSFLGSFPFYRSRSISLGSFS